MHCSSIISALLESGHNLHSEILEIFEKRGIVTQRLIMVIEQTK